MWVEDGARAILTGTELVNNTAVSSYTHKGAGGGVAVSASASLDMSDGCILRGNVAGPEVRCNGLGARRGWRMNCRCGRATGRAVNVVFWLPHPRLVWCDAI